MAIYASVLPDEITIAMEASQKTLSYVIDTRQQCLLTLSRICNDTAVKFEITGCFARGQFTLHNEVQQYQLGL